MLRMFVLCLMLAGCAGSTGGVKNTYLASATGGSTDHLNVVAEAKGGVTVDQAALSRIETLVAEEVRQAHKFQTVNQGTSNLTAKIIISRYDKGNALVRFLAPGFGQIHIDAETQIHSENKVAAAYDISKTFAWGGMVGGLTDIESVEVGFAKAAAKAILEF